MGRLDLDLRSILVGAVIALMAVVAYHTFWATPLPPFVEATGCPCVPEAAPPEIPLKGVVR